MRWSSEWSFPFSFSNNNFVCIFHLPNSCYTSHPSYAPLSSYQYLVKSTNYESPHYAVFLSLLSFYPS
jgi:hypothetical protein